jgi:hypothetical protein
MTDKPKRLWELSKDRAERLGKRIAEDVRIVKDEVGFGGVALTPEEQLQRYVEADLEGHKAIIRRLQEANGLEATDIPRSYLSWDKRFNAQLQKKAEAGEG